MDKRSKIRDAPTPPLDPLRAVERASDLLRTGGSGRRPVPSRWVWAYLGWTLVLAAVYLTVPPLGLPAYALLVFSTVGAIGFGAVRNNPRRRAPWLLLAGAYFAFAAGSFTAVAESGKFPSWPDVIFLGVFLPLLLAGLGGLARSGALILDRAGVIDGVILTTGAGFVAWTFLINPFLQNPDLTALEKAVSVAYPLTDVLTLVVLARLWLGAPRSRSTLLLIVSGAALLTADSLYGLMRLNGDFQLGGPVDLGWLLFYVAGGLAGLHPSMARLTEPRVLTRSQVSARRAVLTVAALIGPGVLLVQALRGPVPDGELIAGVSAVLVLLALARMATVAASLRQTLARERQLRLACEALLMSADTAEVTAVLRRAVGELLSGTRHEVVLALGDSDDAFAPGMVELLYTASLPASSVDQLTGFDLALRCPLGIGGTRIGDLVVGADENALLALQESLPVLAGQAATMIDRIRLNREIRRRDSQAYFRTLVVNAGEVIAIVGEDNRIGYVSPAAERVLGDADLVGDDILDLVQPDARDQVREELDAVREGRPIETLALWPMRRADGTGVQTEVTIGDMREEEDVNGLVLTLRDVTERITLERELLARAYLDPLTGLGNRLRFQDDAAAVADRAGGDRLGAVLVVNVDGFRVFNDTMGHEVGDELLVALSERLSVLVAGIGTVSRLGADEFGVVVADIGDIDTVERLADQIAGLAAEDFPIGGGLVPVRLRLGVATTLDADSAKQLIGQADVALDSSRAAAGPHRWRRYEATLHAEVIDRMQLRTELARAVADEAFHLNYQPIVVLDSGRTVGFEALLRWRHPTRGLVPPAVFIPLAEESGVIVELGAWVLRTAVATAASWPGDPYVSVNVSVRQFRTADFVAQVMDELDRSGLAPQRLTLEITESLLLGEHEQIATDIARLRKAGIKISIDDFGTGYSSLSYLHRVPIDTLKLDKSFVDTIITSQRQHDLVRGIIQMAVTLSLGVVAEGVETEAEHQVLTEAGCAFGQGYLFARPLSEEDTLARIRSEKI